MAAPHVAGAFAAIKSKLPSKTVAQIEQALSSTGKLITDPDNGLARPRIDLVKALEALGVPIGPTWHSWEPFAGSTLTNPECFVSSATQTDCFAKLSTGALGWWRYNGTASPAVVSLGGQVNSPPTCLYAGGKLHCFVSLSSNQLGQITQTGASGALWAKPRRQYSAAPSLRFGERDGGSPASP